jgi:hypothetical protein
MILLGVMTVASMNLRRAELEALQQLGVFKDLDEMNDKEMFNEYDKMLKQSKKVRN